MKARLSVTNKILLMVVPIMVLCVFCICMASGIMGHYRTRGEVFVTFERLANASKMIVEQELSSMKYSVEELGKYVDICDDIMDDDEFNEYLDKKASLNNFKSLYVVDTNGITRDGWDVSSYNLFIEAMKGQPYISEPTIEEGGNSAAFVISSPIWKDGIEDSEVVGVIFAVVDAQHLSNILGNIDVGETGSVYIINSEGYTIADADYEYVLAHENTILESQTDSSVVEYAEIEKAALNGETKTARIEYMGDTTLVSVVPLEEYGWVVGIYADSWEYMQGNITNSYITTFVGVIFVMIAAFVIYLFIKKTLSPLNEISNVVTSISEGDYNVNMAYDKQDEIGDMVIAVNNLIRNNGDCIEDVSNVLSSMSQGDFSVRPSANYVGVFKMIETSLVGIIDSLSQIVENVSTTAENVSSGAGQVAAGAAELSDGASRQAAAVDELAAAIKDLSNNVETSANNASIADDITNITYDEVNNSNEQMKNLMDSMAKINKASNDIVHIVKSIEDIAFQTNILALNAAVEAARAGSAGKGFAVVADEVRNLAAKSAQASNDTEELIKHAIDAVAEGIECANLTQQSLEKVVHNMNESHERVKDIKENMDYQAESLSKVAQSVEQISIVTQANSATSEESAAASDALAQQANMMEDIVSGFKTK